MGVLQTCFIANQVGVLEAGAFPQIGSHQCYGVAASKTKNPQSRILW